MVDELAKRLQILCSNIGILNRPSAEEMVERIKFLRNEFGDFSMDEIVIAFEKAASGFLNSEDNPRIAEHFQSFDNIYLGRILRAYREFRTGQLKSFEVKQKPEEVILDDRAKDRIMRMGAFRAFRMHKNSVPYTDVANVIYSFLDGLKIIPLTNQRKNEILSLAQENLRREMINDKSLKKDAGVKKEFAEILNELENKKNSRVISEAKKIALNVFFNELIETGTELKDLMSKKIK